MYNSKCSLVTYVNTINQYGDPIETEATSSPIFCRVVSADEKEKNYAFTRGETAELVIILPDKRMYHGEVRLRYNGTLYKVIDRKFTDTSREIKLVVSEWQTH